ncbi:MULTISPECIES: phage minor head protein [unclassified Rhizobium]|uniref:phage head morphogenesis protein n=1 Tax=unclassified Rhizobium TaxID=2613769 RepID=UPI00382D443F
MRFRDKAEGKSSFIRARKVEARYSAQLRKIARHVGDIVKAFAPDDPMLSTKVSGALQRYGDIIGGWAEATAKRMVEDVAARDKAAWMEVSRRMGRGLREEIETAPTGRVMRERLNEQVSLIKSIPLEAAQRVRDLANEGIVQGRRSNYIAEEIMRSGDVAKSRANTIARTEVSRTATELTRARAEHVGSTMFIWRTAEDSDVRDSHRALNGKAFRWDDPPECDPGYRALPGAIFNCRCYPEPILPEE